MKAVTIELSTGELAGEPIRVIVRTLGDMRGLYRNEEARSAIDPARLAYRIQGFFPVQEGTEGGLFWGTTFLEPGKVGDEYSMTKGHFHSRRDRAEYYVTVAGTGALILMTADRTTWFEPMSPGSVHYIPGDTAHRVANTSNVVLSFLACWPSDAGHDYEATTRPGFGARMREFNGAPALVPEP
jgi:glucose-6-phosphate isomerase